MNLSNENETRKILGRKIYTRALHGITFRGKPEKVVFHFPFDIFSYFIMEPSLPLYLGIHLNLLIYIFEPALFRSDSN